MLTTTPETDADDLRRIDGVPESAISQALSDRLPAVPPAPWSTSGSGLVWLHRASAGAAAYHQRGLTFDRALPVTLGAFLRYDEGPVGPYDELLAAPTLVLRGLRVAMPIPLIAVSTEISIAAGRRNWALPKSAATFEWPASDGGPRHVRVTGSDWSVAATVRWSGPRLPLFSRGEQTQVRAGGEVIRVPIRSQGVGRLARIDVRSDGPTLPDWLRSGVHTGLLIDRVTHHILPAVADPLR